MIVELGNAWREAQAAVDEEVGRILDELSALVAANGTLLRETLDAMAQFDFWAAKAQLAAEMDGVRPAIAERTEVVLLSARHPGLTGRVVPIDLRLGDGYTALVITGPNTGGKTVALRTLGLLSLMHQAGLHIPAESGSSLPVFRDVFADIGDEQSIAQSLSTFSGHLRSIIRIVEHAGPATLVLLDELGAGTDPTEGSALAQALLDHFIRVRRPGRGDDPLRRDQGLRPRDAGRAERLRRVRPRDAVADVPAHDRPARREPGLRDRGAAGAARGHRGRRPRAPVGEPACLRGDPRLDPAPGGRDRRRRRAGARRRRPRPPTRCGRPTRSGGAPVGSATRPCGAARTRPSDWSRACGPTSPASAGSSSARP